MRLRLSDRALRYILLIYFTVIIMISICYSVLLIELYPIISIPCRLLVTSLPEVDASPLIIILLETEPVVMVFLATYKSELFKKYKTPLLLATIITAVGLLSLGLFLPVKITLSELCKLLHIECSRSCMRYFTINTLFGKVTILDLCSCPHVT